MDVQTVDANVIDNRIGPNFGKPILHRARSQEIHELKMALAEARGFRPDDTAKPREHEVSAAEPPAEPTYESLMADVAKARETARIAGVQERASRKRVIEAERRFVDWLLANKHDDSEGRS